VVVFARSSSEPEAAIGGPLALVQSGDMIKLDVPARSVSLEVDDAVLEQRRAQWKPTPSPQRGWTKLYVDHVMQAHEGADLDFLVGKSVLRFRENRIDAG
jgi:L-arabonate dehydrase